MLVDRPRTGFSLVEVLMALGVLAIGILGASAVLFYCTRAGRGAERHTQAIYWCREIVDTIRTRNLAFQTDPWPPPIGTDLNDGDYDDDSDDDDFKRPLNAPPFANDFPEANFERHVELKRLATDPMDHKSQLCAIKVTVFWQEGGREKSLTVRAFQEQP